MRSGSLLLRYTTHHHDYPDPVPFSYRIARIFYALIDTHDLIYQTITTLGAYNIRRLGMDPWCVSVIQHTEYLFTLKREIDGCKYVYVCI